MKKIIILSAALLSLFACKDSSKTEETVVTTETTVDKDAPGADVTNTTVTKTVETDTSEVSVTVEGADPKAIDTTTRNKRR